MGRKISLSQFKSKIRQLENKQKQAINKYNQEVRKHNQEVSRAINKYNQEVRSYNSRVKANRQRIINELTKLQRQNNSSRYLVFQTSVKTLHNTYERLEAQSLNKQLPPFHNYILDLSEKENANSLEVMNVLLDDCSLDSQNENLLQHTMIVDELKKIGGDLDNRWKGAIFSLHPNNPDAARHFCTSVREIFTQILDIKAPDKEVFKTMPDCEKTNQGTPSRRAKITYLLEQKDIGELVFVDFIDQDIQNIIELFRVLNEGTHGSSCKYDLNKLHSIKKRVEDGLIFLAKVAS